MGSIIPNSKVIQALLTPEEAEAVKQKATVQGHTVSSFVRHILRTELEK